METKTVPTATNNVENNPNRVTLRATLPQRSQMSMDLSKELGFPNDLRFGKGGLPVGLNQSVQGLKTPGLKVPNSDAGFSLGVVEGIPDRIWIGNMYANFSSAPSLLKDTAAKVLPKLPGALAQAGAHPIPQKPANTRVICADLHNGATLFVTSNPNLVANDPRSYRVILEKDGKYSVHTPTSLQKDEKFISFKYGPNNEELVIRNPEGDCAAAAGKVERLNDPVFRALRQRLEEIRRNPGSVNTSDPNYLHKENSESLTPDDMAMDGTGPLKEYESE